MSANLKQGDSKLIGTPFGWMMVLICAMAGFFCCYGQFVVAARAFEIIPALHLSIVQFTMLLSAPMFASIVGGLLTGAWADKYGVKNVVLVLLVFSIVGLTFRYLTNSFWPYFILMFMSGFSITAINSNIGKVVGEWLPPEKVGSGLGLYYFIERLGMCAALATGAMFATSKSTYIWSGILLLACGLIMAIFYRDNKSAAENLPDMSMTKHIGVAIRSKYVWLAGVCCFLWWGGFMVYTGNAANGLHAVRGMDPVKAGLLVSTFFLANAFGSLICPVISDWVGLMKPFMWPTAIVGAIAMYYSWLTPTADLVILFVVAGFLLGCNLPYFMTYPVLLPEIGLENAGSAGGIICELMLIGAFVVPSFIIAPLVGMNFGGLLDAGALCFVLMGICAAFLPELGPKALQKIGQMAQSVRS
jgi:NNP family nitrate/nitrite transporter-like MFS transporter